MNPHPPRFRSARGKALAQSQVDLHKQAIDVFLSLKRQEAEFRDAAGAPELEARGL